MQAFRAEAKVCQDQCNQIHRLAEHAGLTPNEIAAKTDLHLLAKDYSRHQVKELPQDHGVVSFVRLVRRSGRITLGANDRFMVDPNLAYQYVLARIDLAQKKVCITHNDQEIQSYDFTADTIGQWAMDEPQEASEDDELVNVPIET